MPLSGVTAAPGSAVFGNSWRAAAAGSRYFPFLTESRPNDRIVATVLIRHSFHRQTWQPCCFSTPKYAASYPFLMCGATCKYTPSNI